MNPSICLIGPGHLASNPRLVKEADALYDAGYHVQVISGTSHPMIEPLDLEILALKPWTVTRIHLGGRLRRFPGRIRKQTARRRIASGSASLVEAAWVESELIGRLTSAAIATRANLYIGHYLPGLLAAATAAKRNKTSYGFDIEDSHVDELPNTPEFSCARIARNRFEKHFLQDCDHLTASSPMIADRYDENYGTRATTVLNVFPLSEAPPAPIMTAYQRGEGPPKLYWFSQTVGPGRGLELIVRAMATMRLSAELHLRGLVSDNFRNHLESIAMQCGIAGRIHWYPPASSNIMAELAASYDLGLSLELCDPPNRAMCLTNKAFTYLLGGVPVVLSRTPAQEQLAQELDLAAIIIEVEDPIKTAFVLDKTLDPDILASRRTAAWLAARTRYNWEQESKKFLASVQQAIISSKFTDRQA